MKINNAAIERKVNNYIKSSEGHKRANDKLDEYIRSGRDKTKGGSYIMNEKRMWRVAEDFVTAVRKLTSAKALSAGTDYSDPSSVVELMNSLEATNPVRVNMNKYRMEISFTGNLARPSLDPSRYGGIDNIVALFNNGYSAPKAVYVFGDWHGDTSAGRPAREGSHFMQSAKAQIENKYADKGVTVKLDSIYEG